MWCWTIIHTYFKGIVCRFDSSLMRNRGTSNRVHSRITSLRTLVVGASTGDSTYNKDYSNRSKEREPQMSGWSFEGSSKGNQYQKGTRNPRYKQQMTPAAAGTRNTRYRQQMTTAPAGGRRSRAAPSKTTAVQAVVVYESQIWDSSSLKCSRKL